MAPHDPSKPLSEGEPLVPWRRAPAPPEAAETAALIKDIGPAATLPPAARARIARGLRRPRRAPATPWLQSPLPLVAGGLATLGIVVALATIHRSSRPAEMDSRAPKQLAFNDTPSPPPGPASGHDGLGEGGAPPRGGLARDEGGLAKSAPPLPLEAPEPFDHAGAEAKDHDGEASNQVGRFERKEELKSERSLVVARLSEAETQRTEESTRARHSKSTQMTTAAASAPSSDLDELQAPLRSGPAVPTPAKFYGGSPSGSTVPAPPSAPRALAANPPASFGQTRRANDIDAAETLTGAGRCDAAVPLFTRALAAGSPGDAIERALFGRGRCRLQLGQTAAGQADLSAYLARYPTGRFAKAATELLK